MIEVWRICRARHGHAAFSGEGTRRAGGRWNNRGLPVVYTAATASLAVVEMLVHMDPEDAPDAYILAGARIPDDVERTVCSVESLPGNWRVHPPPEATRATGDAWLREGRTAVLVVPSAVIPKERNYLLNPVHPDMGRIELQPPEPFVFDPRLWSREMQPTQ